MGKPNPYGLNILDNLRDGNIVYIGMSAGSMAWGWSLGPLTSDPDKFMLFDADAKVGSDGQAESVVRRSTNRDPNGHAQFLSPPRCLSRVCLAWRLACSGARFQHRRSLPPLTLPLLVQV